MTASSDCQTTHTHTHTHTGTHKSLTQVSELRAIEPTNIYGHNYANILKATYIKLHILCQVLFALAVFVSLEFSSVLKHFFLAKGEKNNVAAEYEYKHTHPQHTQFFVFLL